MADDLIFDLQSVKAERDSGQDTADTTFAQVESTYEQFRKTTDDHAGRADDFGFDTGGNDHGFDDIWGL